MMVGVNRMVEIMTYTLEGNALGTMPKDEAHRAYHEAFAAGRPQPHKHEHVGALLFDGKGRMLTQLRSPFANENAGLTDKTFGGHVPASSADSAALMQIATREYRIPVAVVSKQQLTEIATKHPELVRRQAFITEVDSIDNHSSPRTIADGRTMQEICTQRLYAGIFNGHYQAQEEGTALRPLSLQNIVRYAEEHPLLVTGDLQHFITEYYRDLKRIADLAAKPASAEKTAELIHLYSKEGLLKGTIPRKVAHTPIIEAFLSGKEQPDKHQHIAGVLIGRDGQVFSQIRAGDKAENPGMYDKIVGGHIPAGDSPIVAAYHEFLEEMRIPVAVYGDLEWESILRLFPEVIKYQAICSDPTLQRDFRSVRFRTDGSTFVEISDQFVTSGYYNGDFGFVDKEASGIFQFPSREELAREMVQDPLHQMMVERYGHEIGEHNGKPNLVFRDQTNVIEAMREHPGRFTQDFRFLVSYHWDDLIPLEKRF